MAACTVNRTKSYQAYVALAAYRRVRYSSGVKLGYAGTSDTDYIGCTERPALAADDWVEVVTRTAQGTVLLEAYSTFSAGAAVYAYTNGRICGVGTASTVLVGVALTASTATGDICEVMLNPGTIIGTLARSGLTTDSATVYGIPLTNLKATGTLAALGTSAGTPAGAFGITPGTYGSAAPIVVGEGANGNSKTDYCRFLFVLPAEYVTGGNITLRVKALCLACNTAQTIDASAYLTDGTSTLPGSDLVTTNAQSVATTMTNYDFVITPTLLAAGDVLDIQLTGLANDTGGTGAKYMTIGKVQMLLDIKG